MSKFAPTLLKVLDEVIVKYDIEKRLVSALVEHRELSDAEREQLIDALALEFSATGLSQNDEPNARGLQLEELIDCVLGNSRKVECEIKVQRTISRRRGSENDS